jgi:hypothetical protein
MPMSGTPLLGLLFPTPTSVAAFTKCGSRCVVTLNKCGSPDLTYKISTVFKARMLVSAQRMRAHGAFLIYFMRGNSDMALFSSILWEDIVKHVQCCLKTRGEPHLSLSTAKCAQARNLLNCFTYGSLTPLKAGRILPWLRPLP